MAVESERGCGYRTVGGIYLVGIGEAHACDRLPIPLDICPTCGTGIRLTRGLQKIDAFKLWGKHGALTHEKGRVCKDGEYCIGCYPPDGLSYIMSVGDKFYTPESFIKEALNMGVSKRVPWLPKELEVGKTVIYLSHAKAITFRDEDGKEQNKLGVFYAFRVARIEKLVWESELDDVKDDLVKKGITPVAIPDGDADHAPRAGVKRGY